MATLQLEDIELVVEAHRLKPGDIFVVRLPVGYDSRSVARWDEILRPHMSEGIVLMFLPPDYNVEVYSVERD